MPIYEYVCQSCESDFEQLTTISRADLATCPKCSSQDVKRLVSMFAARSSGGSHSHDDCAGCASGQCGTGSCGCH